MSKTRVPDEDEALQRMLDQDVDRVCSKMSTEAEIIEVVVIEVGGEHDLRVRPDDDVYLTLCELLGLSSAKSLTVTYGGEELPTGATFLESGVTDGARIAVHVDTQDLRFFESSPPAVMACESLRGFVTGHNYMDVSADGKSAQQSAGQNQNSNVQLPLYGPCSFQLEMPDNIGCTHVMYLVRSGVDKYSCLQPCPQGLYTVEVDDEFQCKITGPQATILEPPGTTPHNDSKIVNDAPMESPMYFGIMLYASLSTVTLHQ